MLQFKLWLGEDRNRVVFFFLRGGSAVQLPDITILPKPVTALFLNPFHPKNILSLAWVGCCKADDSALVISVMKRD